MTELWLSTQVMEILLLIWILGAILVGLVIMLVREIYQQKRHLRVKGTVTKPVRTTIITQAPSIPQPKFVVAPSPIPQPQSVVPPSPPIPQANTATPWPTVLLRHNQQTRQLFGKLVKLLQGDSEAANRLLAYQRTKNPDKSEEWVLEKVISDLQRDRH
jgi:hypothetical protein